MKGPLSKIVVTLAGFCHLLLQTSGQSTSAPVNVTQFLDDLFKNYDRRIRPNTQNGTLSVSISMLILDVFDLDDTRHEFSVTMYLRQNWLDKRLQYIPPTGMSLLQVDVYQMWKLWLPDTFILNERNSVRHTFGTYQAYSIIRPDGRVFRSERVTVIASCKMKLGYFPFDHQLCGLELGSFAQSGSDYEIGWSTEGGGAAISEDLSSTSLNFRFAGIKTSSKTLVNPTGNQIRLGIQFFIARYSIRYLQDVFLPSFILALIAFCTLYCADLMVRLQLSIAAMVSMILFMSITSSWVPRVSYQTALDFYILFSALHVFLTLFVNFVQYNFHISAGKRDSPRSLNPAENSVPTVDYERMNQGLNEPLCAVESALGLSFGYKVDGILKTACSMMHTYLPISYLCFNILYWMVVLIGSSWYPQDFMAVEPEN